MQLQIINSNSSGNCYLLENDQEALLIECGVGFDRVKKAVNFNLRKIVGCLITHEHLDHCFALDHVLKAGIDVYATEGTLKRRCAELHHRSHIIKAGQYFSLGSFMVKPFTIRHDAAEPVGFLINHIETGNVLFLTDSYYSDYLFPSLSNIIVEANYSSDIINDKMRHGDVPRFLRDRVLESHMSLNTCKELLKANNLATVNNIVLIHLSDGNSDAVQFQKEIEAITGKTVHVAEPGMSIDFNKTPF